MKGETHGDVLPDRIARLLKDAYAQGGVLSLVDVGLMLGKSPGCVSEVLRKRYRPRHPDEVLPTIVSVFDVDKTMTHTAIAVKLHIQGLLLTEIAQRMDHAHGARRGAEVGYPTSPACNRAWSSNTWNSTKRANAKAEAYPVYASWVECDHATAEGCAISSRSPSEPDKTFT